MAKDRKVFPVPELILDDHIRIEGTKAGEGSMDNAARLMRVPLLDSPACRHVRAHEMAHAKYSPTKPVAPAGVHRVTIQRVEDMRMNVKCREAGLHDAMDAPMVQDSSIWDRLLTGDRENLTAGISTYDTGDWPDYLKHAEPSADDVAFIESACKALRANSSFAECQRQALRAEEYLRTGEMPPESCPAPGEGDGNSEGGSEGTPGGGGEPGEGKPSDDEPSDGDSSDGEPSDGAAADSDIPMNGNPVDLSGDMLDELMDAKLEREAANAEKTPFERGLEALKNGEKYFAGTSHARSDAVIVPVKITVRPLRQRLAPNKFKSRAKVPADRGSVPRYMNRYCTDKAIFAGRGRKRSQGGVILIDCSGSMNLSSADIDRILEVAPLGTIATYNGTLNGEGNLWVIAKNGKRATGTLKPSGLANLVDVPALEWAVKQDGPYYWVCDGMVSGRKQDGTSEHFGSNVFRRCTELVRKHHIIMVPSLHELPDIMRETL